MAGIAVGCTGAALLAGIAGAWVRGILADDVRLPTVNRPVTVLQEDVSPGASIPNVLGLDLPAARQVFLDAGFDPSVLTTEDVPYAGSAGLVVQQDPAPGSPPGGRVTLAISAAATMPPLTDVAAEEARERLDALGARAVVDLRYVDGVPEGIVLDTLPKAGAPLTPEVRLSVAEAPSSVFLTQVAALEADCSVGSASVGGNPYDQALSCTAGIEEPAVADYALRRRATRFTATVGHEDTSSGTGPFRMRVILDGAVMLDRTVNLGEAVDVDLNVRRILRLRLETRAATGSAADPPVAVWADAQLVGGTEAIGTLSEGSP